MRLNSEHVVYCAAQALESVRDLRGVPLDTILAAMEMSSRLHIEEAEARRRLEMIIALWRETHALNQSPKSHLENEVTIFKKKCISLSKYPFFYQLKLAHSAIIASFLLNDSATEDDIAQDLKILDSVVRASLRINLIRL
ncbi:MAG TPA: hypothetical protein VG269_29390 [Tepidisphaeraceae bacterium]|jgi:hypothetical protein|nr:hypothetical protein [Tepidisphaeraceae bacterium]